MARRSDGRSGRAGGAPGRARRCGWWQRARPPVPSSRSRRARRAAGSACSPARCARRTSGPTAAARLRRFRQRTGCTARAAAPPRTCHVSTQHSVRICSTVHDCMIVVSAVNKHLSYLYKYSIKLFNVLYSLAYARRAHADEHLEELGAVRV